MFRVLFGPEVKRSYQFRGGRDGGMDVEGTPFAIECKTGKVINWRKAYDQALSDTTNLDGKPPVVIGQYTHGPSLVMLDLDTFLAMVIGLCRGTIPDPAGVLSDCQRIVSTISRSEGSVKVGSGQEPESDVSRAEDVDLSEDDAKLFGNLVRTISSALPRAESGRGRGYKPTGGRGVRSGRKRTDPPKGQAQDGDSPDP